MIPCVDDARPDVLSLGRNFVAVGGFLNVDGKFLVGSTTSAAISDCLLCNRSSWPRIRRLRGQGMGGISHLTWPVGRKEVMVDDDPRRRCADMSGAVRTGCKLMVFNPRSCENTPLDLCQGPGVLRQQLSECASFEQAPALGLEAFVSNFQWALCR